MTRAEIILRLLLSLTPYRGDVAEDPAERAARLTVLAEDIADVTRDDHEAARLVALGVHETHFARNVQTGHCELMPAGERCDHGRARGVWQFHARTCPAAYRFAAGTPESWRAEALCAARLMRGYAADGRELSLTPDHAAFAGMAARAWNWQGAETRVKTLVTIERQLAVLRGQ
jgi:hypothetical protein